MKKQTRLALLGLAVLGLTGALVAAVFLGAPPAELPRSDYVIPEKTIDVTAIETAAFRIERTGPETWKIATAGGPELDQLAADAFAVEAASIQRIRTIEENPADLSLYGLGPQSPRMTFEIAGGKRVVLLLGQQAPTINYYYAKLADQPAVFTVPRYTAELYAKNLDDFRALNVLVIEPMEVTYVRIRGANRLTLVRRATTDDLISFHSAYRLTEPFRTESNANDDEVMAWLQQFEVIRALRYESENVRDMSRYGLDRPHWELLLQTEGAEGKKGISLHIGKALPDGSRYARIEGKPQVFVLPDPSPWINRQAFTLRDPFALMVELRFVDSFVVSAGGQRWTAEVRREAENETYWLNGKQIEKSPFKEFYQECIGVLADAPAPAGTRQGTAVFSIEYRLNHPVQKKASFSLANHDETFYVLRSSTGTPEFLVSRRQVDAIPPRIARLLAP